MKNKLIAGLALAALAGCASVDCTSPGMMDGLDVVGGDTPVEQALVARVNGFGLLYICTGICGDIRYDRKSHEVRGGFLLFQDMCNSSECYRAMQEAANDQGKQLTNVTMINNSLPQQGITGYVDFLAWFFESEDAGCSGLFRKK